ncbi:MAG: hypothetical protein ACFB4I_00300 [Cyanophyceae cyanobacterium]
MNYLVAVLPDKTKAEAALTGLEKAGLSSEQITIIGQGYQTSEAFSVLDPKALASRRSRGMALWLIPFGFVAGYVFNLQTGIAIVEPLGALGNHVLGGLFGAVAAAMGSFFVGGGVLNFGREEEPPYRDRLQAGKYLVAVKGTANVKNRATEVLQQFDPEDLQTFTETETLSA